MGVGFVEEVVEVVETDADVGCQEIVVVEVEGRVVFELDGEVMEEVGVSIPEGGDVHDFVIEEGGG